MISHKLFLILTYLAVFLFMSCGKENDSAKEPQEKPKSETITSIQDLKGHTMAVMTGSLQEMIASKACPDADFLQIKAETDIYYAVQSGKADAGAISSLGWLMMSPDFPDICCLTDTLNRIPCAIAINKKQTELRDKFSTFIEQFIASGEFQKCYAEWADANSTRTMPEIDHAKCTNGTLRAATSVDLPPFTMIKDNQVSGIEAELVARFAMSQGMDVEFQVMEFSSVIASITTGKSDMGFSCICITPERQLQVDFTIPYTYEATAIIINKKFAVGNDASQADQSESNFLTEMKESFVHNLITEDRYQMLLDGLWNTLIIIIMSVLFGTLWGIILCYFYMHNNRIIYHAASLYIEFMRCMPQMVLLMVMYYIVFGNSEIDSLIVAIISFTLCFGAYTAVIFRSSVESIDKGQTEAALSMGFTKVRTFFYIILPQTVQRALPVYKNEFVGLIKATSIVGYIAVFDLTKAGDLIRSRTYEAFFPLIVVTIIYFVIIWILSWALKYTEIKTNPKRRKY